MPRNSETFWSRVLFRDFIRHFRKMTPEEVAADIEASMDALEDLNPDGESFGSLMVRWANERMNGAFATAARENGKKGGRPRKSTADGPMPEDKQAVMDYASAAGLDIDDAYECWHVTVNERGGLTADNKPINNWKAYVRKWCATRNSRRTA